MSSHYGTNGNGSATTATAEWSSESPFLPEQTHESSATAIASAPGTAFGSFGAESPFRAEFDGEGASYGPHAEHLASLLGSLYDREFDEAVSDLVDDGAAVVARREERESDDPAREHEMSEHMLREYYSPLGREAHAMLDRMIAELGEIDVASLSESEVDARLIHFVPPPMADSSEAFEQFLGGLLKKAKGAIKGAAKLAKKVGSVVGKFMPINLVLGRLKGLINPLLERVLRFALDRLPVALRPVAAQLAHKLFGVKLPGAAQAPVPAATAADAGALTAADASPDAALDATAAAPASDGASADATAADPAEIQQELDEQLAGSLMGGEAFESESAMQSLLRPGPRGRQNAWRELRHARRRFAKRMVAMRQHEDPAPEVENFVPAVLAAAKLGMKIVGRPKVVNFLAGLVAKLISKYVGAQPATALSRALVDTGLRLVNLEASEEEEQLAAGYTLASTVENTVNHLLASAPAAAWGDEMLLESYALEAFEHAATAAFPDSYIRAELREAASAPGAWVTVPGPAAYEKLSVTPEVTITPQKARDVKVFGGDTLASVLRARYGLPADRSVTARLHLYRALPGTTLGAIARRERVPGLGATRKGSALLHPLTTDAARALLGEPGLGHDVDPKFLVRRTVIAPLQRFYYVELRGAEAGLAAGAGGPARARASQVNVVVDFPANELVVHGYHSEPDAQQLAARLRSGEGVRALPTLLRRGLQARLKAILSGRPTNRVRVVHETAMAQHEIPAPLARVLAVSGDRVVEQLIEWSMNALRTEAERRADEFRNAFIAAADAPADGLTISIRVKQPAFLPALRRAIASPALAAAALRMPKGVDSVQVDVKPGFVA